MHDTSRNVWGAVPGNDLKSVFDTISVSVPIRLVYRDAVGVLICQVCERLEESAEARPGTARQVVSAFNEAFNNLVIHGAPEEASCQIEIEVSAERLVLRIIDKGPGFDPVTSTQPDPTTGELREGGYGLHIMRSFMSDTKYAAGVNGEANVLTMVRNLGSRQ